MKPARIIRRCPFCYAPAGELRVVSFRVRNHRKRAVECSVCNARGPSSLSVCTKLAEVIFDWNRAGTLEDWKGTGYHRERDEYARTHE